MQKSDRMNYFLCELQLSTHVRAALPHWTIALIPAQTLNKTILLLLITSMIQGS